MKLVSSDQMRELERRAEAAGSPPPVLMERAGKAVAGAVSTHMADIHNKRVIVLVGPGNNGGDGLVVARYLRQRGADASCFTWHRNRSENDVNWGLAADAGVPIIGISGPNAISQLSATFRAADVVVDALLGVGLARPVAGDLADLIETLNDTRRRGRSATGRGQPFVVAVDVPTGLNADTGEIMGTCVEADLTVTLGRPKTGLFLFPGAGKVGEIAMSDLGIGPDLTKDINVSVTTVEEVRGMLPLRPSDANKGTFGKALVVAGSLNYTGAAYLAVSGAMRAGTGLVTLGVARSIYSILAAKLTESTFLPLPESEIGALGPRAVNAIDEVLENYQALLLGSGLGQEDETKKFVRKLLGVGERAAGQPEMGFRPPQREVTEETKKQRSLPPLVLDADGLNSVAGVDSWWENLPESTVLTPHPGEMSRLLGISTDEVQADRLGSARRAARDWNRVVVLKGAYSVIASPGGDARVNPWANASLATAGTGDVLAGIIVGLLAQGLEAYRAAIAGVYIHALAGKLAAEQVGYTGMLAGDLLPQIPHVLTQIEAGSGLGIEIVPPDQANPTRTEP